MRRWLCLLITTLAILKLSKCFIEELKLPDTFVDCLQKQKYKNNGTASFEAMNKWCINSHRMKLAGKKQRAMNISISQDTSLWINELLRMSNVDIQFDGHVISKRQAVQIPSGQTQDFFSQVQFPTQPIAGGSQNQQFPTQPIAGGSQNQQFPTQPIAGGSQNQQFPSQPQNPTLDQQTGSASSAFQQIPPVAPPAQPPASQISDSFQHIPPAPASDSFQQIPLSAQAPMLQNPFAPQGQAPLQQIPASAGSANMQPIPPSPIPVIAQQQQGIPSPPQGNPNPRRLRVRKEYRMMTDQERENFHRAVLMLKGDTTIQPNRYDALGLVHFRMVDNIHHGGAFLAWHRIFITIMENALRQKVPDVTLPYWDSTMDDFMVDPTLSNIWTAEFIGNGNGLVNVGPFAFWQTPSGPLIRNVGQAGGVLFTRDAVMNVLSRTRMAQITEPAAPDLYNIENYHGDAHTWIGGQMEPMETSAFDPIFFLHHAFVDYIWEIFRQQQITMGIDPSQDYPQNYGPQSHAPFTPTGFSDLPNVFGISNMFTSEIYTYQPHPTCSFNRPTCGSPYLTCNLATGVPRCMPQMRRPMNPNMPPGGAMVPPVGPGQGMGPGMPQMVPGPNMPPGPPVGAPPPFGRKKRATQDTWQNVYEHQPAVLPQQCPGSWVSYSSQNTFEIDSASDTRNWVFIPVRVVSKRSPENRHFNAYAIYDGFAVQDRDIYNPDSYEEIKPYFSETIMPASKLCKSKTGDHSVGRIHIRSDGLNYQGNYDEYVVVDLRQAFTESTTYIALKKPTNTQTEVLLSAYDACGRVCQAYCRNRHSKGYHKCSGGLKVTDATPWEYGRNYGDAVRMSWDLNTIDNIPELHNEAVVIQFYCDHHQE